MAGEIFLLGGAIHAHTPPLCNMLLRSLRLMAKEETILAPVRRPWGVPEPDLRKKRKKEKEKQMKEEEEGKVYTHSAPDHANLRLLQKTQHRSGVSLISPA